MSRVPRQILFDLAPHPEKPPKLQPNIFAKLARFSFRNAILVIIFWLAIISAASFLAFQSLQEQTQRPLLLETSSKAASDLQILESNFPQIKALTTITLNNSDPEKLKAVRTALLAQLEKQHELFDLVFAPGVGEYYEANEILYHGKSELEARVAYALSLKPLFSAIAEAPTAESLSTLVGEVSASIQQGRDPQGLDELFLQSAKSLQALMQGSRQSVDWSKIAGLSVDAIPTTAFILAVPKPGAESQALAFTSDLIGNLTPQNGSAASVSQAHSGTELNDKTAPPAARGPLAIMMAIILMILVLSSLLGRTVLLMMVILPTLAAMATSVFCTTLFLPTGVLALWPLFLSIAVTTIMLATRSAFAAIDASATNLATETKSMLVAQNQGPGLIWLTAIATAVWSSALALMATPLAPIFGVASAGLFVGLMASLSLTPALCSRLSSRLIWPAAQWIDPLYQALFGNKAWSALARSAAVLLFFISMWAAYLAPQILKPNHDLGGFDQPVNIIAANSTEAGLTLTKLKSVPQAKAVQWLGAFLPQDVEAKQTILAGLKDQFPLIGSLSAQTPEDLRDQISTLQESLSEIATQTATRPELRDAADEFRRSLELLSGTSNNIEIIEVENRLFGNFNALGARANALAAIEKPHIETLDKRLKSLFLSPDNIYRLEITPVDGVSNTKLADILAKQGFAVAHPSLVEQQNNASAIRQITSIIIYAIIFSLVIMGLAIGEVTGIASALLTFSVLALLLAGSIAYFHLPLTPELLLIGGAALSLTLCLIASAFLKAEMSDRAMPASFHGIEAWLPTLLMLSALIPIFLLHLTSWNLAATELAAGAALITITVALFLAPLCIFIRRTTGR